MQKASLDKTRDCHPFASIETLDSEIKLNVNVRMQSCLWNQFRSCDWLCCLSFCQEKKSWVAFIEKQKLTQIAKRSQDQ